MLHLGGRGGHESAYISIIVRIHNNVSLFQSFLYAFRLGAGPCLQWHGVLKSKVSTGLESTVYQSFSIAILSLPTNIVDTRTWESCFLRELTKKFLIFPVLVKYSFLPILFTSKNHFKLVCVFIGLSLTNLKDILKCRIYYKNLKLHLSWTVRWEQGTS